MANNDDRWIPSLKGDPPTNEIIKNIYQYLHLLEGRVGEVALRDSLKTDGKITLVGQETEPEVAEEDGFALYFSPEDGLFSSEDGNAWETFPSGGNLESCRVYRDSIQIIPDSTPTAVMFNVERFDVDGMHTALTAPLSTRITIPTDGIWLVGGGGLFDPAGAYQNAFYIRLNGTTDIALQAGTANPRNGEVSISTLYRFTAGDYVQLMAYQLSGGDADLMYLPEYSPEFWAHRLS